MPKVCIWVTILPGHTAGTNILDRLYSAFNNELQLGFTCIQDAYSIYTIYLEIVTYVYIYILSHIVVCPETYFLISLHCSRNNEVYSF